VEDLQFGLYSPLVIVVALVLALGTAGALVRWQGAPASGGRYVSIDGLRGFLAFFVFLHHGSIWYVYLRQQAWTPPDSNLYRHLGDTSVALFFMITAFLFTTKVLESRSRPVDWVRLYVSRVMRLFPLYAVAVVILFVMVAVLTGWTIAVPLSELTKQVVKWTAFTILGSGPVNGLTSTNELIAGVIWTLPYEWWFYLSLPALGLLLGRRSAWMWLVFGFANLLLFQYAWRLEWERLMPFLGGILAAYAVKNETLCRFARRRWSGMLVLALLAATVTLTSTAYTPAAVALLSVAFVLIACGNDLFGCLSAAASRMLGEMTYSIYLLHGLLLSLVFRWVVGMPELATWSITAHWGLVLALSVPLILLSYASYRWIELPAQAATPALTAWVKRRMAFVFVGARKPA
jgi:peptidoglycan/LPS O-acetylase OafA/YrhL